MLAAATTGHPLLADVAITLAVATALGIILQRLRQSVMPGYLLAGLLVGPGALGIVKDVDTFSIMAEVGIALLLFTIGLELPWTKVQKYGGRALLAGCLQVSATLALLTPILVAFDVSWRSALTIAMAVSLSSTAIVIRVLQDRAETESVHGLAATGMLIAQDLVVVAFLLLIPQLGEPGGEFVLPLLESLGKLVALIVGVYLVEIVLMRRLYGQGTLARQREMLALSALVVSLGSVGVAFELGLSPALGGFIAGVMMAEADYADQVRGEVSALRIGLVAIFFAWVGMLADVTYMVENAATIGAYTVLLIAGKALLSSVSMRIARIPARAAIIGGVAVAQLGEFSFAILTGARDYDLVSANQFQLLISVSLVSLLFTPPMLALASYALHRRAGSRTVDIAALDAAAHRPGQIIVVGAGPAGRTVVDACLAAGHAVTVLELNARTDLGPIQGDLTLMFGDAANPELLVSAGIMTARMLVVTIPETAGQRTIIRHARELAPGIHVVARGRYHVYVDDLALAGADEVIDEELVVGQQLAGAVLDRLLAQDQTDAD